MFSDFQKHLSFFRDSPKRANRNGMPNFIQVFDDFLTLPSFQQASHTVWNHPIYSTMIKEEVPNLFVWLQWRRPKSKEEKVVIHWLKRTKSIAKEWKTLQCFMHLLNGFRSQHWKILLSHPKWHQKCFTYFHCSSVSPILLFSLDYIYIPNYQGFLIPHSTFTHSVF